MSEAGYQRLRVASHEGVQTLTLSYPERRNAIGPLMTNELLWALARAHEDEKVRVVVLTGEGKAFCAGGDFAQMTGGGDASELPPKGDYADLLQALWRADKPVIARVNGHAVGGGLGLVVASTFAIASSEAALGTPEINVGLFPMMIMAVLRRQMPRRRLLEMMLTGDKLTAEEGARYGLVNQAVSPDKLDEAVKALADKLMTKSPLTTQLGLRAVAAQDDLPLDQALPLLREKLAECLSTNDAREGLMAFLEKRPPQWSGK